MHIQDIQKVPLHFPETIVGRQMQLPGERVLTVGRQICGETFKVLNHAPHTISERPDGFVCKME